MRNKLFSYRFYLRQSDTVNQDESFCHWHQLPTCSSFEKLKYTEDQKLTSSDFQRKNHHAMSYKSPMTKRELAES